MWKNKWWTGNIWDNVHNHVFKMGIRIIGQARIWSLQNKDIWKYLYPWGHKSQKSVRLVAFPGWHDDHVVVGCWLLAVTSITKLFMICCSWKSLLHSRYRVWRFSVLWRDIVDDGIDQCWESIGIFDIRVWVNLVHQFEYPMLAGLLRFFYFSIAGTQY